MSDTTDSTQPQEAEVRPEPAAGTAEGSADQETTSTTDNPEATVTPSDTETTAEDSADPKAAADTEVEDASEEPAAEATPGEGQDTAASEDTRSEASDILSSETTVEESAAAKKVAAEEAAPEAEAPAPEAPATPEEAGTTVETPAAGAAVASSQEAEGAALESAAAAQGEEKEAADAEAASESQEAKAEPPVDPALLSPRQRKILELKTALDEKLPVEGTIIGWNQGGFHISIEGVGAFVPSSLMELGATKDPATYLDKTFLFRVIKHQKQGRRIVLSRVPVLRELRRNQLAELRSKLEVGAVLPGKVTSLTGFGAFVDLGGLEGLVHVSEISHQRVSNPSEALQIGQEVQVEVLKIEKKGKRISLSMKALENDPWSDVAARFGAGTPFQGKVLRHADFGVFVELEPGIEGLLHTSQLRPGMKLDDPALAEGETLEGWVRVCEPKRQRLSLSLREVADKDPWIGIEEKYPDGKLVEGKVEQIAPFGAFITLEPGLTGLLPQSEMRVPKGADPRRQYAPGQSIQVQVVEIDRGRRRIGLALEGARIEGSKADIEAYKKAQKPAEGGLGALAAAFEKARRK